MAGSFRECALCLADLWRREGGSLEKEDQVQVLAEMAITVPVLHKIEDHESMDALASLDLPTDTALWSKVVQQLASTDNWEAVRTLVLAGSFSVNCPLEGVAAKCSAEGIEIRNFLYTLSDSDLKRWGINLAVCLLKKGADVNTVCRISDEPVPISALITALQTGVHDLFKYIMENIPAARHQIDNQNQFGGTALHIIVKSEKINSFSGEALLKLLLSYGCRTNIRDRHGKLPIDYLDKKSTAYGILINSSQKKVVTITQNLDLLSNTKLYKEEGNLEFKKQNYPAAVCHYNEAIKLYKERKDSISDLNQEERHDLSVLYGNRAECFLKLGQPKEAFDDARQSVEFDPNWHKAHVRVGRSFQALNKAKNALKAFVKAYNLLPATADNSIETEILSEIIIVFHQVESKGKYSQLISGLNPVKDSVWVLTAYNFIRQNLIWNHAYMVFQQIKSNTDKLSLDLKPFCKKKEMRNHVWSLDFVLMLLQKGSDHRTLSFDDGDTYLHAGALTYLLTGIDSVFKWLVDNKALPLNELNIQDRNGNTVLHFAVMTDCNIEYKDYVVSLLLKSGANPLITNNLQKKALECLRSGDQRLKMLLESAEKDVCKVQHSKPLSKKKKKNLHTCQLCEKLVADAKDLFTDGEYTKGIENLVEVIKKSHTETKHQQLSAQSADIIVDELGKMLYRDIPACMTSLSVEHYKSILEKFAKKDKWRQIDAAVKKYDSKHGHKKLSTFAANISLVQLVKSSSLRGSESLHLHILDLISSHGAVLPVDDASMLKAAVSQLEFRVVKWLIDHGVSPSFFSLTPGDTPVHAALTVALEKDKGNFQLFDKFLSLYKEDSEKYKCLNPSLQDKDGNNLSHIACRCRFKKQSLKAVKRLCELQVPLDVTNNEEKMAVQYLTDKNDQRAQFLDVAVPPSTQPKMKTSSAGNLKINHPSSHKTISKKKQNKTSFNRDSGNRVSSVKNKTLQRSEEQLEKLINNFSYCKSDDSKQHGSKKNEYVSQTSAEEVETACSESAEERIAAENLDSEETYEEDVDSQLVFEDEEEIDPKVFDNSEREVDCSDKVLNILKGRRFQSQLKERVFKQIERLVLDQRDSYKIVHGTPSTLKLFETKFSRGGRIIWEKAIAFSPRLTEAAKIRFETKANNSEDFRRIYSQIIRVWDIVRDHDDLNTAIENIITNHENGKQCLNKRTLKQLKDDYLRDS